MKSLLPSSPIELILDNPGDGMRVLRKVRDLYIKKAEATNDMFYLNAAAELSRLLDDSAVDQTESLLCEAKDRR